MLIRAFELVYAYNSLVDDQTTIVVQERILAIFRRLDLNSPISYDVMAVLQRGSKVLSEIVNRHARKDIHINTDDAKLIITVLFTIVRSTSNEDFIDLVNNFLSSSTKPISQNSNQRKNLRMILILH